MLSSCIEWIPANCYNAFALSSMGDDPQYYMKILYSTAIVVAFFVLRLCVCV